MTPKERKRAESDYRESKRKQAAPPEIESAPCSPIDWEAVRWRRLEEGEEVKEGDYSDACADGWNDEPRWEQLFGVIPGNFAPANYPAHRKYRRIIPQPTTPA